jgi:hypothetical protein
MCVIQVGVDEGGEKNIPGLWGQKSSKPRVWKGGIWKLLEFRNVAFHFGVLNASPSGSINI